MTLLFASETSISVAHSFDCVAEVSSPRRHPPANLSKLRAPLHVVERGWGEVVLLSRFLRPFRGRREEPTAPAPEARATSESASGTPLARYLVVGLGNPGSKYANSRHNIGAACINRLAKRHQVDLRTSKLADSGSGTIDGSEAVLLKPRTWYNNSGDAVIHFMQRDHIPIEHVIVLYDDLDLPEGRLRLRLSGSDGGNNGLKSIIQATNSRDFGRIRIGIGRPLDRGVPSWDPDVVIKHVLGMPPRESRPIFEAAIDRTCDAVEAIIRSGWERAMDVYNRAEP